MTRPTRRGTAPLELALVLPLLFTITVVGWWCVRAGLTKTAAASDARRTAWEKRADADPGTPFDLRQLHLTSGVESEVLADVPAKSPFSGQTVQARSFSLMTDTAWDHTQFEIPELPPSPVAAHRKQLLHFGRFIEFIRIHGPSVGGFRDMDLMANSRFNREFPKADRLRARRYATLPTFVFGPIPMGAAAAECFAIAAEFPLLAPHYEPLGELILRGAASSLALVPISVK